MGPRVYEGMSLREVSDYLFVADEPGQAELVMVFGGKRAERGSKAAQLYKQGLAPRILVTGGDRRGTGVPEAETLKATLMRENVPETVITLETNSTNTWESVQKSVPIVDHLIGWKSMTAVILVSSPVHMKRVKQVVARYIPREVKIYCVPDDRSDITRDNWWTTEEGREQVFRELEKVRSYAHQGAV